MRKQIKGAAEGYEIDSDGNCYLPGGNLIPELNGMVRIKRINGKYDNFDVKLLIANNFGNDSTPVYLHDATVEQLTEELERRRLDGMGDKVVREIVDMIDVHCARSNLDRATVINKLIAALN